MKGAWCVAMLAACSSATVSSEPAPPAAPATPAVVAPQLAPAPAIVESAPAIAPDVRPRALPTPRRPPARRRVDASIERASPRAAPPRIDDELALHVDLRALDLPAPPAPGDEPTRLQPPHRSANTAPRRYGVAFDVGVPDGATTALVVRPTRTLELGAGVSYNGIATGVRGELAWAPLAGAVTPTISFAGGRYGAGDANPLVRWVTGRPMFYSPLLDRVGYNYADAHVGVELRRRAMSVYLRAGACRVTGVVHGIGAVSGAMPLAGVDPQIALWTVSARAGVVVNFGR
jgi:hypothetical protein